MSKFGRLFLVFFLISLCTGCPSNGRLPNTEITQKFNQHRAELSKQIGNLWALLVLKNMSCTLKGKTPEEAGPLIEDTLRIDADMVEALAKRSIGEAKTRLDKGEHQTFDFEVLWKKSVDEINKLQTKIILDLDPCLEVFHTDAQAFFGPVLKPVFDSFFGGNREIGYVYTSVAGEMITSSLERVIKQSVSKYSLFGFGEFHDNTRTDDFFSQLLKVFPKSSHTLIIRERPIPVTSFSEAVEINRMLKNLGNFEERKKHLILCTLYTFLSGTHSVQKLVDIQGWLKSILATHFDIQNFDVLKNPQNISLFDRFRDQKNFSSLEDYQSTQQVLSIFEKNFSFESSKDFLFDIAQRNQIALWWDDIRGIDHYFSGSSEKEFLPFMSLDRVRQVLDHYKQGLIPRISEFDLSNSKVILYGGQGHISKTPGATGDLKTIGSTQNVYPFSVQVYHKDAEYLDHLEKQGREGQEFSTLLQSISYFGSEGSVNNMSQYVVNELGRFKEVLPLEVEPFIQGVRETMKKKGTILSLRLIKKGTFRNLSFALVMGVMLADTSRITLPKEIVAEKTNFEPYRQAILSGQGVYFSLKNPSLDQNDLEVILKL